MSFVGKNYFDNYDMLNGNDDAVNLALAVLNLSKGEYNSLSREQLQSYVQINVGYKEQLALKILLSNKRENTKFVLNKKRDYIDMMDIIDNNN